MLADHLLAFSIWLLIALTFIPIYIHLQKQFERSEEDRLVSELFYQYLMDIRLGEAERYISYIEREGKSYSISWKENGKVCISYEDVFHEKKDICEKI